MSALDSGEGFPIAVLKRNKSAFYCVPADIYEAMLDRLEDQDLTCIVKERSAEPSIRVSLEQL